MIIRDLSMKMYTFLTDCLFKTKDVHVNIFFHGYNMVPELYSLNSFFKHVIIFFPYQNCRKFLANRLVYQKTFELVCRSLQESGKLFVNIFYFA